MSAPLPQPNLIRDTFQKTKHAFWYVAIFSLCINVLMLALPIYSLQVLDRVLSSHSMETLVMLTLLALAVFVVLGLFTGIRSFVLARVGEWLEQSMGPELLSQTIQRSSVHPMGSSSSQTLRDLATLKQFITSAGVTTLFDAPWSIIFFAVIFMIHPVIGVLSILGGILLLCFAFLTEIATRKPLDKANQIFIGSMSVVDTATRNAQVVEAMGMMDNVVAHWKRLNDEGKRYYSIANDRSSVISAISKILRLVLQVGVIGLGAWFALNNEMTPGGMIAASILVGRALAPFEASIGIWKAFVASRDAYSRLHRQIDMQGHIERGAMELPRPKGLITVEGAVYRPPQSDRPTIKGISFRLAPGDSLGIIGPSAAGKSTLGKLLVGVWQPMAGSVRLDGADVFKWNRRNFGKYMGYLPQEVELFTGTVKDNIARMDVNASPESVVEAAQMAGVHDMILRLPQGYDTPVAPGILTLSPGQRQLVGLARAFYGAPQVLILDEPNANLDGSGEAALLTAIGLAKQRGMTTVVIAHRPSILGNIDYIMVLKEGQIADFGPRQQVMAKYMNAEAAAQPQPRRVRKTAEDDASQNAGNESS